jgi:hypothetical protein
MKYPQAMLAALGVLVLSLAPLSPAQAGGPGYFGPAGALLHGFFGLATLPLVIIGAVASAAQSQQDPGYAPPAAYYGPRPGYYPQPPGYFAPGYYAPHYYSPPVSYYRGPSGYYGARPGYYARSGYQAPRRSGYYHYPR